MAGVDFGDSELFEQLDDTSPMPTHIRFTDDEEGPEDTCHLRSRLGECDETIRSLVNENEGLKRKLNVFSRPSGVVVENVKIDGPLLQILYANNSISKLCRQEIEDTICGLIQKHQTEGNQNNSSFQMNPQNSTFVMEEDKKVKTSSGIKTITEAFNVVGSVLYFTTFCVDKLGQPLLNENPQLTEGWDVPTYQQVFNQVISLDGQEVEVKDKRPKSMCFNCGAGNHLIRDCPKPKDMAAINERRKEFSQGNPQISQTRYHADEVEERFAKYKPGVMSEELLTALGVSANTLPPLIYRMRQMGYPPGWLKEAELENSGLTLYDGNAPPEGNSAEDANGQKLSYDVSKLVDFPGFNVPAPQRVTDDYMQHGSVPMQHNHMKHNFAAYLSNNFPLPGATCNKRQHSESDSSHQQTKRRRSSPDKGSDMDLDSDSGTPRRSQSSGGFQFQPPLPPGSPSSFGSPPPLPMGTPPATPTRPPLPKGTPPPTPTNGSPALSARTWGGAEEAAGAPEDGLTLEELEEQQRLLWAALENADTATNSDSETPVMGTPVPSSPSVSTPAHVDTETEMEEGEAEGEADAKGSAAVTCHNGEKQMIPELSVKSENNGSESLGPNKAQEDSPVSPGPVKAQEDSPVSPGTVKAQEDSPVSRGPVKAQEDKPQSPGTVKAQEDNPQSPGPVKAQEDSPVSPGPVKAQEDKPQSPGPVNAQEDKPQSPGPVKAQEDKPQSPGPVKAQEDNPQGPVASTHRDSDENSLRKVSAVPHRSKFQAGIVPFEDTPEFTEVAEATGTYLRIRDLLKTSPRNVARFKK